MDDATKKLKAKLMRASNRLVRASVAYSWKDAAHPDDRVGIERSLDAAIGRYRKVVSEVFPEPSNG